MIKELFETWGIITAVIVGILVAGAPLWAFIWLLTYLIGCDT